MVQPDLTWELAKAHRQMLLEEAERERLIAEYKGVKRQATMASRSKSSRLFTFIPLFIFTLIRPTPFQAKGQADEYSTENS